MKDELLRKLRKQLAAGVSTEASVLYVLVKVRKLLERDAMGGKFATLNFFCDWALHTRLDRGGAQRIIKHFDEVMEPYLARDMNMFAKQSKGIEDLLTAQRFRNDLKAFLEATDLPTALTTDPKRWRVFLDNYIDAIADTPLEINPLPVKYVQSVTIKRGDAEDENLPSRLSWAVKLFDHPNPVYFSFRFEKES